MSDKEPAHVTVRILEKEYFVSCPQDERADLLDSAEYLNKKMREIQSSGKVIGTERTAVMAALNIAHELMELRGQGGVPADVNQKLRFLQSKIDAVLRQ